MTHNPVHKIKIQLETNGYQPVVEVEVNGKTYRSPPLDIEEAEPGVGCSETHSGPPGVVQHSDRSDVDRLGRQTLRQQARNGLVTLFLLGGLQAAVEWIGFREDPVLLDHYLWWIFYLDLTIVSLVVTIGYLRSYRYAQTNHMISMMIGMTVGMQVGMMTGGVIGATDGYFLGALVGVGLGTLLGVHTAWCCGPMAITQALMSGVMGGTMGSMIVAMMPSDRLMIFMPIFTLLNIAILIWFSFLFFRDCVIGERCHLDEATPFWRTFLTSALAVTGLGGLMVLNPEHSEHFKASEFSREGSNPFRAQTVGEERTRLPPAERSPGSGMSCGSQMKH